MLNMRHEINLEIDYEGARKSFTLMSPSGAGADGYHVYINNFYQGSIFFRNNAWHGHMNDKCKLSDLQIKKLGKIIDKDKKNPTG